MATSLVPARSVEHRLKSLDVNKGATGHQYPSPYQINTRVCLNELSRVLRRRATLDDFSDAELEMFSMPGSRGWLGHSYLEEAPESQAHMTRLMLGGEPKLFNKWERIEGLE